MVSIDHNIWLLSSSVTAETLRRINPAVSYMIPWGVVNGNIGFLGMNTNCLANSRHRLRWAGRKYREGRHSCYGVCMCMCVLGCVCVRVCL